MPFKGTVRGTFGAGGLFGTASRSGASALAIKQATGTTLDGLYSITVSGQQYETYCIMSNSSADGGGWTLAYNIMFNEAWIQGQRGAPGGGRSNTSSYNMNGFWNGTAPGGNVTNIYDMTLSSRAAGAYVDNISKVMVMYHTGTNTNQGLAHGWYTKAAGVSGQSLRTWFSNNTRNQVWSTSTRSGNYLSPSWVTPYGNSLRDWPGGGDLFVNKNEAAGISDPRDLSQYALVLNGSRDVYGYSSSDWNDSRFTTTFANGSFYGHTLGGIGVDHNNGNYQATALAIGLFDYCDGRRTAIYGNGSEAVDVGGSSVFGSGCLNGTPGSYNTGVLGLSIFVK